MGHSITVEVNGQAYEREVEARRLLVHFLRDDLELDLLRRDRGAHFTTAWIARTMFT